MERVVVTGIGIISPLGLDAHSTWQALLAGKSGVGPITAYDASAFRVRIAAEVKGWDPLVYTDKKRVKEMDRFTEFAVGAAAMAVQDAGLELTEEEKDEAGCIIGVGLGGIQTLERTKETVMTKGPTKISPYSILQIISNLAAGQVSLRHQLRGPSYCTTSACSSSAHALGDAYDWIRTGRAPVMIAGGAEATISPVGMGGFEAMMALSKRNDDPTRASRPFDRDRDGFVCGEGSAVFVLESLTRAKARGAKIYGELTGYGATSDAFHSTQPAPKHAGAQRAMKQALRVAGLNPEQIGYINAHATSTPIGDNRESEGIEEVFGEHAKKLWISSTKSMTGHLLGGAGALESAFCLLALQEGMIPPTINLDNVDPECRLDYVPNTARERRFDHVLNNSFGFGGTNCALVFSRVQG